MNTKFKEEDQVIKLRQDEMNTIYGGDVTVGEAAGVACGFLIVGLFSVNIAIVATSLILSPTACGVAIGSLLQ